MTVFDDVTWIVGGIGGFAALWLLFGGSRHWDGYGRHLLTSDPKASSVAIPTAADEERDEEIRQLLEARNALRARRGETPPDAEHTKLTG